MFEQTFFLIASSGANRTGVVRLTLFISKILARIGPYIFCTSEKHYVVDRFPEGILQEVGRQGVVSLPLVLTLKMPTHCAKTAVEDGYMNAVVGQPHSIVSLPPNVTGRSKISFPTMDIYSCLSVFTVGGWLRDGKTAAQPPAFTAPWSSI